MRHKKNGKTEPWDEIYSTVETRYFPVGSKKFTLNTLEDRLYIRDFFYEAIGNPKGKKVLSVGGGIDYIAIQLAMDGAEVVYMDNSEIAAKKTKELSLTAGAGARLNYVVGSCGDIPYENIFDLVISHRALHHMNFQKVVPKLHGALSREGVLIAEEPVCLLNILRYVHKRIPFHPNYPYMETEIELSTRELALMKSIFSSVDFYFFDFLTRNSIAYFMGQIGLISLIKPLSRLDHYLIRLVPVLRYLSTYTVIKAVK